jgi:hypothetical protein
MFICPDKWAGFIRCRISEHASEHALAKVMIGNSEAGPTSRWMYLYLFNLHSGAAIAL